MDQLVASALELLMEDSVGMLVTICQSVCQVSTAAHHLLHCPTIEGQKLTDFEAEDQWQVCCQYLLYPDLQADHCCWCSKSLVSGSTEHSLVMAKRIAEPCQR